MSDSPITSAQIREVLQLVAKDIPQDDNEELLYSGVIDSYALLEVIQHFENHFGVTLGPSLMKAENFSSVNAMCRTLNSLK